MLIAERIARRVARFLRVSGIALARRLGRVVAQPHATELVQLRGIHESAQTELDGRASRCVRVGVEPRHPACSRLMILEEYRHWLACLL